MALDAAAAFRAAAPLFALRPVDSSVRPKSHRVFGGAFDENNADALDFFPMQNLFGTRATIKKKG